MKDIHYLVLIVHPTTLTAPNGTQAYIAGIQGFCPVFTSEEDAIAHAKEYNTTYLPIVEKEK